MRLSEQSPVHVGLPSEGVALLVLCRERSVAAICRVLPIKLRLHTQTTVIDISDPNSYEKSHSYWFNVS